jgi:hypothetical protein
MKEKQMWEWWTASLVAGSIFAGEPTTRTWAEEGRDQQGIGLLAWNDDEEVEGKDDDDDDDDDEREKSRRSRPREGRREGPFGRRPPGPPPGPPGIDVEFDIHVPPPMRPEDRLIRDGEFWVLEQSAIRIKATDDNQPFDPAGPIKLKLEDGREIEILPSRFPGPPPVGPPHRGPFGGRGPHPGGPPPHDDDRDEEAGRRGPPHGGPHGPPPGFSRTLHDELRPMPPGKEVEEKAAKESQIEHEIRRLREGFGRAGTEEKEKLRAQIIEKVKEQFESRQDLRRAVLDRIRQDLERIETSIKKREEGRDGLIEKRIQEIVGDGSVDF